MLIFLIQNWSENPSLLSALIPAILLAPPIQPSWHCAYLNVIIIIIIIKKQGSENLYILRVIFNYFIYISFPVHITFTESEHLSSSLSSSSVFTSIFIIMRMPEIVVRNTSFSGGTILQWSINSIIILFASIIIIIIFFTSIFLCKHELDDCFSTDIR